MIPTLYQLTLKLQTNDIIVLCDGQTDRQTDRQLSYYNIDYCYYIRGVNQALVKIKAFQETEI